jgi:hypothetical protein
LADDATTSREPSRDLRTSQNFGRRLQQFIHTPSRKSPSSYIANTLWGRVCASDAECAVPPRLARNRPVNPPSHLYTIITDVADRLNPTALIEPGLLPELPRLRRAERWVESGLLEEAASLMCWPNGNDRSWSKTTTCLLLILDICEDISKVYGSVIDLPLC